MSTSRGGEGTGAVTVLLVRADGGDRSGIRSTGLGNVWEEGVKVDAQNPNFGI